jgi:hypothetical protein
VIGPVTDDQQWEVQFSVGSGPVGLTYITVCLCTVEGFSETIRT